MADRVLLVHRYFWPDVPTYAQMLRFIGAHLQSDGHEVTVFCGPISYNGVYDGPVRPRNETLDGMRIIRIGLPPDRKNQPLVRGLSMVVFAVRLIGHVIRHRTQYDLVSVTTIPPVVMGVAGRIIHRVTGIPYIYHCMDLYPEVAEFSGMVRSRWLLKIAARLDATTCRNAAAVVVLSSDMRKTLERRGLDGSNVVILNNFEVLDGAEDIADPVLPRDGKFRVLFAGNMGWFQGLEDLITAARHLAPEHPELEFVFMGAGARLGALKKQAGDLVGKSIRFVDHQPVAIASAVMGNCDIGVVSLRARVHEVAYPSKTAMYLTAGCRLVTVVETDSDLARLVRDQALGTNCEPGDIGRLVVALQHEIQRGKVADEERARVAEVGEQYFGRTAKLDEWTKLIANVRGSR